MLRRLIGILLIVLGVIVAIPYIFSAPGTGGGTLLIAVICIIGGVFCIKKKKQTVESPPTDSRQIPAEVTAEDKELQLKTYITTNVINSENCTNRKFSNKNIDFKWLFGELSDFYEGHLKWSEPTRLDFADQLAVIGDGAVVSIKGTADNCFIKVHVPVDVSGVKANIAGAAASAIGNMVWDKFLIGSGLGKINTAYAVKDALEDKTRAQQELIEQAYQLEQQIASHIDDAIKSRVSTRSNSSEDVMAQIMRLSELKENGVLTNEEFEAKKKDLLGRI